jgi:hypothetical protein
VDGWFTKEIVAGIAGVLLLLFLVLFIWNIILSVKFGRLKKQFRRLTQGTSRENLEQILEKLFDRMDEVSHSQQESDRLVEQMHAALRYHKGRMGFVRYAAFQNEGSDLSFSLALVDESNSGVVLTSIYGRDESRMYAKPIDHGVSMYQMSEEERQALALAAKNGLSHS